MHNFLCARTRGRHRPDQLFELSTGDGGLFLRQADDHRGHAWLLLEVDSTLAAQEAIEPSSFNSWVSAG